MRMSGVGGDLIVTHALGSCLGIALHDPMAEVGGLIHAMLPTSTLNPEKAKRNPYMFVDTAVPALLDEMLAAGAAKNRLVVKVAGGAAMPSGNGDRFAIGKRNYLMLRKVLWKHDLLLDAEDIGGETPRTMSLEVGSGHVRLSVQGQEKDL
jgi:chemotaxis protein CheD